MTDRENVIKALECCKDIHTAGPGYAQGCILCPYGETPSDGAGGYACFRAMIKDVLALLKAQEPRVMTLEEIKRERICWIEDADDGMIVRLFPATMFGIGEYANGSKSCMFLAQKPWAIDVNDCEWWYLIEDYGETWRCWTAKPTEEQREATPWE